MLQRIPRSGRIALALAVHWCTPASIMFYTNYLLWSNDFKEITVVPRIRKDEITTPQDGEVLCQVVPFERKDISQDGQGTERTNQTS